MSRYNTLPGIPAATIPATWVCDVCHTPTNTLVEVMYVLRGRDGTPRSGRIIMPHSMLCEECCLHFTNAYTHTS